MEQPAVAAALEKLGSEEVQKTTRDVISSPVVRRAVDNTVKTGACLRLRVGALLVPLRNPLGHLRHARMGYRDMRGSGIATVDSVWQGRNVTNLAYTLPEGLKRRISTFSCAQSCRTVCRADADGERDGAVDGQDRGEHWHAAHGEPQGAVRSVKWRQHIGQRREGSHE